MGISLPCAIGGLYAFGRLLRPAVHRSRPPTGNHNRSLMHRSSAGPHYAALKAELGIIAISLATAIDARC